MSSENTYYGQIKEKLKGYIQIVINRKIIKQNQNEYYKNNKERLREQAQNCYKNVLEEEKGRKWEYGRNAIKNVWEK